MSLATLSTSDEEIEILRRLQGDMRVRAKTSLLWFISCVNSRYQVNWHHKIIADRLSKLPNQKSQRIMIFVPPQTGKSEIVSRSLPAWMLGVDPKVRIILASYAADLAVSFNRDTQKIMDSDEYAAIFPDSMLNGKRNVTGQSWKRTSNFFETVGHGGYLMSVGVGGATTGKGADLLIIDDPIKDWKQAYSPTYRANIMDWYNAVAQTRLSLNGHIVVMHTRWHKSDLAGQLLKQMSEDPLAEKWEVISLPATGMPNAEYRHPLDKRDKGQPLWPSFKGDEKALAELRVKVGEKVWAALFQQYPTIEGGNIIKDEWIHYYTDLPFTVKDMRHHNTVLSWDMNFKDTGSSYVCGLAIVFWDNHFFFVDCYHKKVGMTETLKAVQEMKKKFPYSTILIEDKANGSGVIDLLKEKIPGIIAILPDATKDERLELVAPYFEESMVLFPFNASWRKEVIEELQSFPNSENDDIVDATSQGLRHFNVQKGIRHLKASTKW